MINPLIKYYLIPLVLLIACSCESDVDMVILPEFKQKPVITAFISPSDAVLKVAVSSNKKIYGELNSEFKFSNLKCFLADDSSEKELDTCAGGFCLLSSNMPIIAGRKYRLRMTADNDISAEAECTIPANRHFSLRVDTFTKLINTDYGILSKQYLRIIFNDNPDESNYYRLFGSYESYVGIQIPEVSIIMNGDSKLKKNSFPIRVGTGWNIKLISIIRLGQIP